ncbi:NACHT domain-containing protein [Streptomyces sp. HUAS TT20]|uniref:NACHT domain-containing protein n=1 Tax=Streptomyces sp. HUAS TT20 TaxID=3447509 RepID=UPI0021D8071C|nr:NACHT domain-containing protein [Streptomyces sp. HUAS 15-9]UXY32442.1 NACHT domain-containing protein [Streptomyces sp. HUAS 15-9]
MNRYWRHGIWAAAALAMGVVFVVAGRNGDLGDTGSLTAVLGFGLSVTGLAVSLLREGAAQESGSSRQERIDRLTGQVAEVVQEQWQAEWRLRQLQDPAPLQVGWAPADPWLSDHRENIGGPEDLSARLEQIVEVFAQVPSRRLVVLGERGSGKSVLALRFTLDLLERRGPQDPVPVVFSVSNWQPDRQGLQEWMAASLAATYPGATWGRDLLAVGRVLPVLDGLDEIPAPLQAHAIRRLNAELDADAPVLLTCRTRVYADVVQSGDVFTAAAVVELQPPAFDDASAYLRRTARPTRGPDGQRTTRWAPVLDHVRTHPHEPAARALRQVLASPLMVAMARTVYDDTGADPAELLDPRFHDPAVVEQHLLDAFVPAAFRDASVNGEDVRRWLGFLARHLQQRQTRDLAWWQLRLMLPRPLRLLGPLLLLGCAVVAAAAVTAAVRDQVLLLTVPCGYVAGIWIGYLILSRGPTLQVLRRPAVRLPRQTVLVSSAVPLGVAVGAMSRLVLEGGRMGDYTPGSAVEDWSAGAFVVAMGAGLAIVLVLAALGVTGEPHPSTAPAGRGGRGGSVFYRVMSVLAVVVVVVLVAEGASTRLPLWIAGAIAVVAGIPVARAVWPRQGARPQRRRQPGKALVRGLATSLLASLCLSLAFGLAAAVTLMIRADLQGEFVAGDTVHEQPDGTRYAVTADGWRYGPLPDGGIYVQPPDPIHGVLVKYSDGDTWLDTPSTDRKSTSADERDDLLGDCGVDGTTCIPFNGPIRVVQRSGDYFAMVELPSGTVAYADSELIGTVSQPLDDWSERVSPARLFSKVAAFGLQYGLAIGLISCMVAGLQYWLTSPADTARTSSPIASLRADRATAVIRGLSLAPITASVGFQLLFLVHLYSETGSLIAVTLLAGLLAASLSAWGWLLTTRLWLCGLERLPWRLMAFLDDAHRRGVLRQAGAVYQFRHARLQEQLATTSVDTRTSSLTL